jgi:hypothetical protein
MALQQPEDTDRPIPISPLTERVLDRLGRPRSVWILVWALVPLISPLVYTAVIRMSGQRFETSQFLDLLATQIVVAYACLVLLSGAGVMARQATGLRDELVSRAPADIPNDLFLAIESVVAPIALTGLPVAVLTANGWLRFGPLPALAALPLLVVYLLPIVTFVWVYFTVLAELDRLGGRPLVLDQFPQDRTLGLEKVGSLASTGLILVIIAAIPVLVAGADEPATLGVTLTIMAVTVGLFMLSMWRLHRQMVDAKAHYVAVARRLYADAYAPIRETTRVVKLEAQANVLSAAQALEDRAQHLMTWPIDEGTLRFMAVVITGVVTSLAVRALFGALGV